MAYKITDACVKGGSCADNCPVEAISEGEDQFVIDADVCVSCGACADNCPVQAIEEGGLTVLAFSLRTAFCTQADFFIITNTEAVFLSVSTFGGNYGDFA